MRVRRRRRTKRGGRLLLYGALPLSCAALCSRSARLSHGCGLLGHTHQLIHGAFVRLGGRVAVRNLRLQMVHSRHERLLPAHRLLKCQRQHAQHRGRVLALPVLLRGERGAEELLLVRGDDVL